MSVTIMLPEPPVVRQTDRHICWAAAYESWARAEGRTPNHASASNIVRLLAQVGRGSDHGHGTIVDDHERLLPDGLGTFGTMAAMRLRVMRPAQLTADVLRRLLAQGYVWLWGEPRHGHVAHVVVVFGLTAAGTMAYMDPLLGICNVPMNVMIHRMRMFAVGTPLLQRIRNPFTNLFQDATVRQPMPSDPYSGLRTGLTGRR